eukprot:TRINITY_DN4568_c0_g1_i2.p1 TRINITY_DN4568_c0_g1~~TRINITY_DN4568_c0_g1_i2.p1  ORF type:complete len:803 (+),score=227.63 TRINITY_DN4568_c0_g1_i2:70-2409(+)
MDSDVTPSGSARSSRSGAKNVMVKDPWMKGTPVYIVPMAHITRTAGLGRGDPAGRFKNEGPVGGSLIEDAKSGSDAQGRGSPEGCDGCALHEVAVKVRSGEVFTIPPKLVLPTRGYESYKRQAKRDFMRPFALCEDATAAFGGTGCPNGIGCGSIHVDNDRFKLEDHIAHTPCCWHHGDSLASKSVVPAFVVDGLSWKLPVGRWARTRAQDRLDDEPVKLPKTDICLRHILSKCTLGRACPKTHICRVWTHKVRLADNLLKDGVGSDSSTGNSGTAASSGSQNHGGSSGSQNNSSSLQGAGKSTPEGDENGGARWGLKEAGSGETRSDGSSGEGEKDRMVHLTPARDHSSPANNESSDSGSAEAAPSGVPNSGGGKPSGPLEGSSGGDIKSSTFDFGSASRGSGTGSSEDIDLSKTVHLCKHFLEGFCKAGSKCKAAHVDTEFIETCRLKHNTHGEVAVQDPAGRVFTVPYGDLRPTQGLEAYKRKAKRDYLRPFPLCPHSNAAKECDEGAQCASIHIDPKHFSAMTTGQLRTPCCSQHGDTLCSNTSLIAGLVMNRHIWRFPTGRMALTAAPKNPEHWAEADDICTAHLWGKCKAGRDCTKYHVCRMWLRKVRLVDRLTQMAQERQPEGQAIDSQSGAEEGSGSGSGSGADENFERESHSGAENGDDGRKSPSDDCPTLLSSMDNDSDMPALYSDQSSSDGHAGDVCSPVCPPVPATYDAMKHRRRRPPGSGEARDMRSVPSPWKTASALCQPCLPAAPPLPSNCALPSPFPETSYHP